jgi:DEAD/DEAH box helicase domain-containing protein
MLLNSILDRWRSDKIVAENIVAWRTYPARSPQYIPFPEDLNLLIQKALQANGINELFSHQLTAWDKIRGGHHVVIATGTASGKSLCYNLPVFDNLLADPNARALYLFPTKALAQDQLIAIRKLINQSGQGLKFVSGMPISSEQGNFDFALATYDGDTPKGSRPRIRENASIVISNPDMLHAGILPQHTRWVQFFQNLRYVVIDEMHIYRGVFGSHVANVLRRLKRIALHYGASPQFIFTSATIGNPGELANWLIEDDVSLIEDDGSARGGQHFLIYNPPIIDPDLGLRRGVIQECVDLVDDLLTYDVQTIVFARTRRVVEIILRYLREKRSLTLSHTETNEYSENSYELYDSEDREIRAYRSGYLPSQRREIEHGLRDGSVRAVIATTALELGIDIGGMGASILTGYPGTISASWQQAGRAGRTEDESLAILITSSNPLDQFLAHNPAYFFEHSPERALINPDNLLILLSHIRCAAYELPFQIGEGFGCVDPSFMNELLSLLVDEGVVYHSGDKYFWMSDSYPSHDISLRSASPNRISLQNQENDETRTVGEIDLTSAMWMVHPDAIYLHEGRPYLVRDLDLDRKIAILEPFNGDYYTEPQRETKIQLVENKSEENVTGGIKVFGEILVNTQVISYRKILWHTRENIGRGLLDLPPTELLTTGYWLSLSEMSVDKLQSLGLWSSKSNKYGVGWNKQRDRARARDNYRCKVCDTPEGGREHDVHHITPFRMFTSIEQANQLTNLVTLCPRCHRRVETAVRVRSGLAGLAFALGHLAPLFLMCDSRDIGIYSDPQLDFAGGQPSVVIYDMIPAGIGFSERLFEIHDELMGSTVELISSCECSDGCPSCVGPGGENGYGGKQETIAILKLLSPQ